MRAIKLYLDLADWELDETTKDEIQASWYSNTNNLQKPQIIKLGDQAKYIADAVHALIDESKHKPPITKFTDYPKLELKSQKNSQSKKDDDESQ